ncbi:serine/threonine protein kinase [Thermasporomyces composti]|mgnify:CR=1 FL=1|uniref:non-specific serine/threonine protein kinase n=1 Tax=Thermasporomyces composti TaxID=696763 RepID=A0A3D9VCB3_THECX|nr:protein kinase [Thermasporomyces composti]REF34941.1 protein kinase-like protein [Thermasporomyces composti]
MRSDFDVDGYEIEGLLGAGRGGQTWLAREESTGVHVALHRMRLRDRDAAEDARRLVERLSTLNHPNIRRVRELLPLDEELVLVLEHIEGGTLGQLLLVRGTLDPGEVVTLGATVASALAAAHERGLVHGDLSPDTILLSADGTPMVSGLAFGRLAAPSDDEEPNPYLDPAETQESEPTPAGDVYSLAAICYMALTGLVPRPKGHRPVHQVAPGVPPGLAHAVEAGLQRAWDMRPHMGQFGTLLEASCRRAPIRLPEAQPDLEEAPFYGPEQADAPTRSAEGSGPAPYGPPAGPPASRGPVSPHGGPPPAAAVRPPGPVSSPATSPGWRAGAPSDGPRAVGRPGAPGAGSPIRSTPEGFLTRLGDERGTDRSADGARSPRLYLILAAAVLVVVAITGIVVWQLSTNGTPVADPSPTPTRSRTPTPTPSPTVSLDPLTARWKNALELFEERRAKAFAERDPDQLTTLYIQDSPAYTENRQYMREMAANSVARVLGLRRPIHSIFVVSERPKSILLEVERQETPYTIVTTDGKRYRCEGGPLKRVRIEVVPLEGSTAWRILQESQIGGPRTPEVRLCLPGSSTG